MSKQKCKTKMKARNKEEAFKALLKQVEELRDEFGFKRATFSENTKKLRKQQLDRFSKYLSEHKNISFIQFMGFRETKKAGYLTEYLKRFRRVKSYQHYPMTVRK